MFGMFVICVMGPLLIVTDPRTEKAGLALVLAPETAATTVIAFSAALVAPTMVPDMVDTALRLAACILRTEAAVAAVLMNVDLQVELVALARTSAALRLLVADATLMDPTVVAVAAVDTMEACVKK